MLDPANSATNTRFNSPGQILSPGHCGCGTHTATAGTNTFAPGHAAIATQCVRAGGNHLDSGHLFLETRTATARVNTLTPVHSSTETQRVRDRDTFAPSTSRPKSSAPAAAQDLTPGHPGRAIHSRHAGDLYTRTPRNKGAA
jgi:hypothetical protein